MPLAAQSDAVVAVVYLLADFPCTSVTSVLRELRLRRCEALRSPATNGNGGASLAMDSTLSRHQLASEASCSTTESTDCEGALL